MNFQLSKQDIKDIEDSVKEVEAEERRKKIKPKGK